MRPEHATAVGAERFLHEARCLARINHPGLVSVHEVGELEGLFFYVMDLVDGSTLAEAVEEGPLPEAEVARVADGLLGALSVAHEAGIVHRDVKPSNVIRADGRVILVDFGIATTMPMPEGIHAEDSGRLTADGTFVGTPAYAAPEQLAGRVDDPRSDVFSAAAVIFEMATGRAWYRVDAAAPDAWEGVPPGVAQVLRRALHPDIERRWESADSLRRALREAYGQGSARSGRRVWPWIAFPAAAIGILAIGATLRGRAAATAADGLIGSIAVLCVGDGTTESDRLASGLEEELRHRFGALDIVVPGPYSRGQARRGSAELGSGVDAVLSCNVSVAEDSVNFRGRLLHAESQRQMWGEEFHKARAHAFRLEDSVTRAIVRSVLPTLASRLPAEPGTGPPLVALELHSLGQDYFLARTTDPGGTPLDSAQYSYEMALDRYPEYADAYAGLAEVWLARPARALAPARAAYDTARALARIAMEGDPLNARPYAILGELTRSDPFADWGVADSLFRESIRLGRNYSLGRLWYSFYLAQEERSDEATRQAHLAYLGDPGRPDLSTGLGMVLYLTGATDSAVSVLTRALEAHQADFETPLWLAAARIESGEIEEAAALIASVEGTPGLPTAVFPMLAAGYAAVGESERAAGLLDLSEDNSPFWQAVAHWWLGQEEAASRWLARAAEAQDEFLSYMRVLPLLDSMRGDSTFRSIQDRLGEGGVP